MACTIECVRLNRRLVAEHEQAAGSAGAPPGHGRVTFVPVETGLNAACERAARKWGAWRLPQSFRPPIHVGHRAAPPAELPPRRQRNHDNCSAPSSVGQRGPAGVPLVSRWCLSRWRPVGVPLVAGWCPAGVPLGPGGGRGGGREVGGRLMAVLGGSFGVPGNSEIRESVRGKDVYIIQTGSKDVNDSLMELLIMCYACKTSSCKNVIGVVPYIPYSKQTKMKRA